MTALVERAMLLVVTARQPETSEADRSVRVRAEGAVEVLEREVVRLSSLSTLAVTDWERHAARIVSELRVWSGLRAQVTAARRVVRELGGLRWLELEAQALDLLARALTGLGLEGDTLDARLEAWLTQARHVGPPPSSERVRGVVRAARDSEWLLALPAFAVMVVLQNAWAAGLVAVLGAVWFRVCQRNGWGVSTRSLVVTTRGVVRRLPLEGIALESLRVRGDELHVEGLWRLSVPVGDDVSSLVTLRNAVERAHAQRELPRVVLCAAEHEATPGLLVGGRAGVLFAATARVRALLEALVDHTGTDEELRTEAATVTQQELRARYEALARVAGVRAMELADASWVRVDGQVLVELGDGATLRAEAGPDADALESLLRQAGATPR